MDFKNYLGSYIKSINQFAKIIVQDDPFRHVWLLVNNEMIFDPLHYFIGFDYQHNLNNVRIYDHPYNFHYDLFISKVNMQQWEQVELDILAQL